MTVLDVLNYLRTASMTDAKKALELGGLIVQGRVRGNGPAQPPRAPTAATAPDPVNIGVPQLGGSNPPPATAAPVAAASPPGRRRGRRPKEKPAVAAAAPADPAPPPSALPDPPAVPSASEPTEHSTEHFGEATDPELPMGE